ncbi:FIST N-terminal domain-containing protein [Meridianimarinicoccus sp. RP-17]|uniref:FIST N-terminal domain-containing protein n=1 Tax=Meridianimarinicoccus zhengii TaxID=2056810 RepID=UPI001F2F10C3|nr:FIST N-terminal domain-containing protein [Phycocomes zhengii]
MTMSPDRVSVTSGVAQGYVRRATVPANEPGGIGRLAAELGPGLAQVFLFIDAEADFDGIIAEAQLAFAPAHVVACTTAGEISGNGYTEGDIVAAAFPSAHFATSPMLVTDLDRLDASEFVGEVIRTRMALDTRAMDFAHAFAFLVVDGLSRCEDYLMATLASGMSSMPVFGGSAGDGVRFDRTRVAFDGTSYRNAAVITFVRTACPVRVFSLDHLEPGDVRMVVTRADPGQRIVCEINARPAAREYARILGKNPDYLSQFTFAAHPLVVRVGGRHHVRAIQRVTEDGALVFFSAIDEGLVLTLARVGDIAGHLEQALDELAADGPIDTILACDCILRRIEATQKQAARRVSDLLSAHNVVGFNTYGEQVGAKHVNHTMTGVAIYPPGTG